MSYLFLFGKHRRNPLTGRGEVLKSSYSDCKYQIIVKFQNMSCIAYFILLTRFQSAHSSGGCSQVLFSLYTFY